MPAVYGRDCESGEMRMPLREKLGLRDHSFLSPELEDYLSYSPAPTGSVTGSATASGMSSVMKE